MRTLIAVIGFLGILCSIIWLLMVLILRKRKRNAGIAALASLVLFIVGLAMPSGSPGPAPASATQSPEQAQTTQSTSTKTNASGQKSTSNQPQSVSTSPTNADGTKYMKAGDAKISPNGGLGDSADMITLAYGNPTRTIQSMNQGFGFFGYENDKVQVNFTQGRASHVTRNFDDLPMAMTDASKLATDLMPPDAKFIKSYDKTSTEKIYVYQSEILSKLFDDQWFENTAGDVQHGYFDVDYLLDDNGNVVSVDAFVGDNP